ncbi:MAG: hypothetical protein CSA72_00895 [Rhodobacterales bacterium]|nr:MAG: hypothetical protein CSA72_00895 [Rhodobacterales bacterium]
MIRLTLTALSLTLALPATAQEVTREGLGYNAATGLPYEAPGRGIVDYDALVRRELEVLKHQFGAFRDASAQMESTARAYCAGDTDADAVKAATRAAWIAWAPLDSYQFGPMEHTGAALTVNFWPDKRGFVNAGVAQIYTLPEAEQGTPEGIAKVSAAGQGFPALAEVLTNDDLADCPAVIGLSANLAGLGERLDAEWFGPQGWAEIAGSAGPDNPVYLAPFEFTKEIYSSVMFGLIRAGEQRIARPMGTERGGIPARVDGHRLAIGSDLIKAQLAGAAEMLQLGFAGDVTEPDRAWVIDVFEQAEARIDRIGMPLAEAVVDPDARWRVGEALNKITYLKEQMDRDIGPELGVDTGFSPADGD